jgi:hypothetical protein
VPTINTLIEEAAAKNSIKRPSGTSKASFRVKSNWVAGMAHNCAFPIVALPPLDDDDANRIPSREQVTLSTGSGRSAFATSSLRRRSEFEQSNLLNSLQSSCRQKPT